MGLVPRLGGQARLAAILGVGAALVVSLWREGLPGMASVVVPLPAWLPLPGEPVYRSDALSAGLGAWCLALGLLAVLKVGSGQRASWQIANAVAMVALLYSLAHTDQLLAYAGQLSLLAALIVACQGLAGSGYSRVVAGLGLGAALLFGATLLMGRTMGGAYSLSALSLSALSVWPLALLLGFCLLWLGLPPVTGWSARLHESDDALAALIQSAAIGLPVFTLLLRLQGLVSAQALTGTVPDGWSAFMAALSWLGAVSALVTGGALLVWAGNPRWTGMLTAFAMSLALWALGQDNPLGRLSGLIILLAYGAGRMLVELSGNTPLLPGRTSRVIAVVSLAAAPFTPAFLGVWLLAALLSGAHRPGMGVVLAGAVILAACGVALHYVGTGRSTRLPGPGALSPLSWVSLGVGAVMLLGGLAPGLWVPYVARMAEAGGGTAPVDLRWEGAGASGLFVPVLLLALGGAALAGLSWAVAAWARSSANVAGVLLPTGLDRLQKARERGAISVPGDASEGASRLPANPPGAVWWLSLTWLEGGVWGFGALLGRLGARFGGLLGRMEGRFYLPLALVLALVALLVAAR